MGSQAGMTLHALAAAYLKEKYNKPHAAYVGIVSRLDSMTSGVIVLARTSKAAARLNAQFADHAQRLSREAQGNGEAKLSTELIRKTYLAVADRETGLGSSADSLSTSAGRLDDYLFKDDAAHRMRVSKRMPDGAKAAALIYRTLGSAAEGRVLAVAPLTGRKHQIRVQFAARGWPIRGDRKYGSSARWPSGIALHSYQLTIEHPTRRVPMTFSCPLPSSWSAVLSKSLQSRLRDFSWDAELAG